MDIVTSGEESQDLFLTQSFSPKVSSMYHSHPRNSFPSSSAFSDQDAPQDIVMNSPHLFVNDREGTNTENLLEAHRPLATYEKHLIGLIEQTRDQINDVLFMLPNKYPKDSEMVDVWEGLIRREQRWLKGLGDIKRLNGYD
ncbi:MAG: hypothetical protein Q9222_003346 [Ikaeria aurantiellina]